MDKEEMFIPFRTEGKTVLFNSYVPSHHRLETCSHIVLTYGKVEWNPENLTMDRKMPYGDEACVAEMYRKSSKGSPIDVFHKSDLILGSVTDSVVADKALEWLVSAINVNKEAPSRISNGKAKEKMVHKKWTLNKMVTN